MSQSFILLTFLAFSATLQAQTWSFVNPPVNDSLYSATISWDGNQMTVYPRSQTGVSYTYSASGGWMTLPYPQVEHAFYDRAGNLYIKEDSDTITSLSQAKFWRSTDNGVSFTEIMNVSNDPLFGSMFRMDNQGRIFTTTSNGFQYSTDNGANWTEVSTPATTWAAAVDAGGNLYFSGVGLVLYQSTDGGSTWNQMSAPYSSPFALPESLEFYNGKLYYNANQSLLAATLPDTTFTHVNLMNPNGNYASNFTIYPDGSFFANASGWAIHTSNDEGENWPIVFEGFNNNDFGYFTSFSVSDSMIVIGTEYGVIIGSRTLNTVGLDKPQNTINVKLYPNPCHDLLSIETAQPARLQLFDLSGKIVVEQLLGAGQQQLKLQDLPGGTYLYRITGEDGAATGKLLVE